MAQPQAKKQKTGEDSKSPIVFESPGLKADLCFKVFDQEFHVNSMVMKVHCGYFRTFLEPSGGLIPYSKSHKFASQWFTAPDDIDDDGFYKSWTLSSDHQFETTDISHYLKNSIHEIKIFEKFLCALSDRPYQIGSTIELHTLAEFARYYMAVPAVSTSLHIAIDRSPDFFSDMKKNPMMVLDAALILKHETLFRDSLILSLGPWSTPKFKSYNSGEAYNIATKAYGVICGKVMKSEMRILGMAAQNSTVTKRSDPDYAQSLAALALKCLSKSEFDVLLPKYYLACREDNSGVRGDLKSILKFSLTPFTHNGLSLAPQAVSGKGKFEDYFLCLETKDIELPWDETTLDH